MITITIVLYALATILFILGILSLVTISGKPILNSRNPIKTSLILLAIGQLALIPITAFEDNVATSILFFYTVIFLIIISQIPKFEVVSIGKCKPSESEKEK